MDLSVYEAKCEYSYEVIKEMTRNTRKISFKIYYSVIFFVLALIEALYVIRYKKKYMIIIIGIALIIAAISYVVLPVLNVKKQYIEMLAGYDGENMKTRIKVFEEGIEHICIQGNDRVEVTFDKIQKVIESRNLFILLLKGNVAIVAEKSKFEKGNPYGFANFIRYKITNTEEK